MNSVETNWEEQPSWANYSAVDRNGAKYIYQAAPIPCPDHNVWDHQPETEYWLIHLCTEECEEWHQTLRQRP